MNFEPQKFFIGLMDFFSILLPGALLSWLLMGEVGSVVLGGVLRHALWRRSLGRLPVYELSPRPPGLLAGPIKSYPEASIPRGSRQPSNRSKPLMSCERVARPSEMDQNPSSRSEFIAMLLSVARI